MIDLTKGIRISKNMKIGGSGQTYDEYMVKELAKELENTKFWKWSIRVFNIKERRE